jgi:hypothetical protein
MLRYLISFLTTAAAKTDIGLIFLRATFLSFLVHSWLAVLVPRFRGHYRRSNVPVSLQSSLMQALAMTEALLAVCRIQPFLCVNLAIVSVAVGMLFWHRDRRRYEKETIRLSFKPDATRRQPDQLWVGKFGAVGAFWLLTLYVVLRDLIWPYVGRDAELLTWMARGMLGLFSALGLALYMKRPRNNLAAGSEKS